MTEREQYRELNETLTQVRLDIRELMTEVRGLKELQSTVSEHDTRITQTEDSTKSAHKRLDNLDKIVFWISTTIIGAVIIGIIALLIKGGK